MKCSITYLRLASSLALLVVTLLLVGCDRRGEPQSSSGVRIARVTVTPDPQTGLSAEQTAVGNRLLVDNKPGAIKHLYVIAPRSGTVILYSTVKGKITSSGKRLTPRTVPSQVGSGDSKKIEGFDIGINGGSYKTQEVLQDDGTYGSSAPYIYWFDQRGAYHQHFFTSGQNIKVSDQPLAMRNIILNLENPNQK